MQTLPQCQDRVGKCEGDPLLTARKLKRPSQADARRYIKLMAPLDMPSRSPASLVVKCNRRLLSSQEPFGRVVWYGIDLAAASDIAVITKVVPGRGVQKSGDLRGGTDGGQSRIFPRNSEKKLDGQGS